MSTTAPRSDLITTYGDLSPFAEAYRSLKMSILHGNGKAPWSIGLTGLNPEHGATTTAANLGLISAETENRVILVDGDLYKPSLHEKFGVSNERGLSTVLEGKDHLDNCLQTVTDPPVLKLLAAGPKLRNPTARLRPNVISDLLHELRSRCDMLIVDLPSVASVAYTAFFASFLDGLLLVVRAGTPRMDVEQTIKRRLQNAHVLGMVLNRVPVESGDVAGYRHYAKSTTT
jgi:capsular exopolysaccharide synthesis family protein